jgi:hypothetical protein
MPIAQILIRIRGNGRVVTSEQSSTDGSQLQQLAQLGILSG